MAKMTKKEILEVYDDSHEYTCLHCGKSWENPVNHFYRSPYTKFYTANSRYVPLCRSCVQELFDEYERKYGSKMACILMCAKLDIPFYNHIYDTIIESNNTFSMGMMIRVLNTKQYQSQDFTQTILSKELNKTDTDIQKEKEVKWSDADKRNRDTAIEIIGYDPFENYPDSDRRFLFNELIKYLDDDDVVEDHYKISQIIQIVNNNNQIRTYDALIIAANPRTDQADIDQWIKLKQNLVSSNDKIAKENEISVKNRSNKEAGRSSLTYLMKDLRQKNFEDAEVNYYKQLYSPGAQWAATMSMQAIKQNTFFDDNDREEIFNLQRSTIDELQAKVDSLTEENRLLKLKASNESNNDKEE